MTDKAMLAATSLEGVYRHHNSHQHMIFLDCRASQQQRQSRGAFMFDLQDDHDLLDYDHDRVLVDSRGQHMLYKSNNKKLNCNNESQQLLRQAPPPALVANNNKRYTTNTTYLNGTPYSYYDDHDDNIYQDKELEMELDNIIMYDDFSGSQHYLTLEDLKSSKTSCWLCGCNWLQDHVSLDCSECGGYALTRPCPDCNGKCDQVWTRNIGATHNSHQALWVGQCSLKTRLQGSNKQQQLGGEMVVGSESALNGGVGASLFELEKKNNISNTLKPNQRQKQQQPDHHHHPYHHQQQQQQQPQQQQQVRAREQ